MKHFKDFSDKVCSKLKISQTILSSATVVCALLLVASVAWGIKSCSSSDYDFRCREDAVLCYREFLTDIRKTESLDASSFSSQINKWFELRDTVIHYLASDSTFNSQSEEYDEIQGINDSVRNEFMRLSETWKCSFSDLVAIKVDTSPFKSDKEVAKTVTDATPFFLKLDSMQVPKVSKDMAIDEYRMFLVRWARNGITSERDMYRFIAGEDIHFRCFLSHLYELENDSIADITHITEDICTRIFREARNGRIDPKLALTYMSMRTVRRLLQNSTVCVNDIRNKRMRSDMQANAYLWMIIQPFLSIDRFAIATITPEERQNFSYIAEQIPKSTGFSKAFNIDQRALSYLLPQQILKMYIQTL